MPDMKIYKTQDLVLQVSTLPLLREGKQKNFLFLRDEMNRKKDKKHSARSAGRIIIENTG
ncbi:MAG: hypothetical protein CVU78_08060 [Elusimicrobia bacterium HGW-Elusimicrobia-2]|nr:MAG: hypothetical protein CVU78_08060 [Elusimicrobia bacterium HGW-Elusimicrobia-2]